MARNPEVSVIVPAYNAGAFLEECLDSLRGQSFSNFEVLVVDDGSTDDTADIACRFADADPRFRVMCVANGGVSRARNIGIDETVAPLLVFVDADDRMNPHALRAMHDAMARNGADVCITGFTSKTSGVNASEGEAEEVYDYLSAMKAALYQKRIMNAPWGIMLKRDLLDEGKRFREGTRYEDLDAFYRFYEESGRIVYLPFPYYFYRDNPESFMHRWSPARLDVLDVTDRLLDYMALHHPELEPAARDRRFSAHYNMLLLMWRHGVRNPEAKRRCKAVIREGRRGALADPGVRLKNKIGALLSYFFI